MKIYDLKEACEILKISEQTIRKYIKNGELKASLVGAKYLITNEYIKEFLELNLAKKEHQNDI